MKFVITTVPALALISLGIVTVGIIYFKNIRHMAEKKEPRIIAELREEKQALETKLAEEKQLTGSLEEKLVQGSADKLGSLSLFREVVGAQDKSANPVLSIERIELVSLKDKVFFQFNIVNNLEENVKLAGYVVVAMKFANTLSFFPEETLPEDEMQIRFTLGESFATYRFRPVNASFPAPKNINASSTRQALFRIFIFSRTGDLIHKQTVSKQLSL